MKPLLDESGVVRLAVEVKDRKLNIHEVQDKLPAVRAGGIEEVLFLIRGGVEAKSEVQFEKLKKDEFSSGHNIYSIEFEAFFESVSILLGHEGRRELFILIGQRIDELGELVDRQAWRDLLLRGVR